MTTATKTKPKQHDVTVTSTGRTVVTALGGSAALGLLTAAVLPAIPVATAFAAVVGLVGGAVAAKLDKTGSK